MQPYRRAGERARVRKFQSSTRQTDFATLNLCHPSYPATPVSILYEADRLCNLIAYNPISKGPAVVSILYEADRLCNPSTP